MKLPFAFFIGAVLASAVIGAPHDVAHAGDCYADPVYDRAWSGTIKIGARVRDGACMEGTTVLTTLPVGTAVKIIAETDGWLKVQLPDGTKGWVGATLITVNSHGEADNTISEEKSYADPNANPVSVKEEPVKAPTTTDTTLEKRLRGYILLDVENHGEAWYVSPDEGKRYYMKDGPTAYEMMRQFGLGISEADFAKLQAGNADLKSRLKGKIVLRVQQHGEAYYIHPEKGSVNYLKNGDEAYRVMRELSLGIKQTDLAQIKSREFAEFVKERETKSDTETSLPVSGSIKASATVSDGKVSVSWQTDGVDASMGFKVVWAKTENPVYPGSDYHYLSDASEREDEIEGLPAGVYFIRVCQYLGGKCGVYSNNVQVTVGMPAAEDESNDDSDSVALPAGVDIDALNQYWLAKINALRAEKNLRQLVIDERWEKTAAEWAAYMGTINKATHDRPDGKTMHQWIDTKGLPFTTRYSDGGWKDNYFTENISYGFADGNTASVEDVLDEALAMYLAEASSNGAHYRTIYHPDWNSVGLGVYLRPDGSRYKVFVAFHYGSLVL